MVNTDEYVAQLETELSNLKTQLEQAQVNVVEKDLIRALNNMPDGAIYRSVRDLSTGLLKFEFVSQTWEQIVGVSREDSLADMGNFFKFFEPEHLQALLKTIKESLDPLKSFSYTGLYNHPVTKTQCWLQVSSYPRYEGNFVIAEGFVFDITSRKEAELKLHSEKERLRSVSNKIPDSAFYSVELDTQTGSLNIPYVSETWEAVTGITSELTLIDINNFFSKINEEDVVVIMQKSDMSSQTLKNFHVEFRIMVQGIERWLEMSSRPRAEGNLIVWDGIILDITNKKKAEAEIQSEKKRLQMLGDNIPGGALFQFMRDIRTGQMRMSYVSAKWESVTGVSAEATLADMSNLFNIIEPDDLMPFIQTIEDSARSMSDYFFETRIGGSTWVHFVARPRREGFSVIWDGIITNITERKIAEYELNTEKNRLKLLGDNIPGGALFQLMRDIRTRQIKFSYVSATWETVTGVPANNILNDANILFLTMPSGDFPEFKKKLEESAQTMSDLIMETRFGKRWISITSRPRSEGTAIIWDGIMMNVTEQKAAKRELEHQKERLETLGNNIPDGSLHRLIYELDTEKFYLEYANSTWEKVTGFKPEQLKEDVTLFFNALFPDDAEKLKLIVDTCRVNPAVINSEVRINNNGEMRWIHISSHPYRADNKIIWDGIITDITERKNAEAELAEYRENLEFLVKERTEELATAIEELQVSTEELQTSNEELYATNEELYATNEELAHKNDMIAQEMSARLEAMQRLEESENKMSTFFIQTFEGIVLLDSEGRILEWNPEQERITNITRANAIGKYAWDLYKTLVTKSENIDEVVEHFRKMLLSLVNTTNKEQTAIDEQEFFITVPGVDDRYVIATSFRMALADNTCYIGQIVRDITQKKVIDQELEQYRTQLEQMVERKTMELVEAKEKAEESDKLKSAFLANMSHEIRTPLNGIVGFLRFLDKDNLSPNRRHEYINVINNSSMQLARIIDDIIDISKIEAQQLDIFPIPINLNEMMSELWIFFETYLQSKNKERIELILDESGFIDDCVVLVDAVRLRQILNNLIGNAVKFTEKGFIRFGYRRSAPDQIEFVVEDSGIGLSPDQTEVIFERFRQAEPIGVRKDFGGTGLGLTISRSLVKLKGGEMWVQSTEGAGSSFYFNISYLPVSQKDMHIFDDAYLKESHADKPFYGKTVLLVESKRMKYNYYERLISATGATLVGVDSLEQWISIVEKASSQFDIVLADASLFDHEDITVMRRIKTVCDEHNSKLPVVFLMSEKKEKYMQLHKQKLCNQIVELPIDYDKILKIFENHLK